MKENYELKKEGELYTTEIPSGSGLYFGFRKWSWGDKNALTSECSVINEIVGSVNFNSVHFNEQLLVRTVYKYEADKFVPLTIAEVREMDGQLGERLFQITQKLNLVSNVETQNL